MYPITAAALNAFQNNYEHKATIAMNGVNESRTLTEADIKQGGLIINTHCISGNKIEIGSAISAEASIILDNGDGRFNNVIFEGAELFISVSVTDENNVKYTIPKGYFTVNTPPRKLNSITLSALDRMVRFNKAYNNNLTFPTQLQYIIDNAATQCEVPFSISSISGLPNYNMEVSSLPTGDNLTYRNIIQWAAELMGTCAYIDYDGYLKFSWYVDTPTVLNSSNRFQGSNLYESNITITGVHTTLSDNSTYLAGTEDYAFEIKSNSLLQKNYQAVLNNINTVVNGFSYLPYSCNAKPMPHVYPLDKITYVDKNGVSHTSIITNVTYRLNSSTALEGRGETSTTNSYAAMNPLTADQKTILEKNKTTQRESLDERSQALIVLNDIITNSLGLFTTTLQQDDGSYKFYMHDAVNLADSMTIYTRNANGYAWTTTGWNNGNPSWQYGNDKNGNAVYNALNVFKLSAKLIATDTLDSDRIGSKSILITHLADNTVNNIKDSAVSTANNYTDSEISNYSNTVNGYVSNLQSQIDGSITTWFYDVPPTTSNAPASNWTTTDAKNQHLGDLYYDTETGYCYRWQVVNNNYSWTRITDTDVTKALSDAAKAQDTADHKRRVFVSTPTVPYDVGDLWPQGTAGDLYKCKTAKSTGSYSSADWEKAVKYTDDKTVNDFISGIYASDKSTLENKIDTKAEIWFYSGTPTLSNPPANAWEDLSIHIDDLYYDTETGYAYRFKVADSVYSWERIQDQDTIQSLAIANAASDTADHKRAVFVAQPTTPYDEGDLWINNQEIYVCQTARATGNYTAGDFAIATKYTDDTKANENLATSKAYTDDSIQLILSPTYKTVTCSSASTALPTSVLTSKVKPTLKGNTAYNKATNGDFSNGTNGYSLIYANLTASNNVGTLLASVQYGRMAWAIKTTPGNKLFCRAIVKSASASVGISRTHSSLLASHSGSDNFETLSYIYTASSATEYFMLVDLRTSNWNNIEVKEISVIDLTALLYNNLTISQCNAMFVKYFSGLKSIDNITITSKITDNTKSSILTSDTPLRRLPNGVYDEKNCANGNVTQRVHDEYTLVSNDITGINTTSSNDVDYVVIKLATLTGMKDYGVADAFATKLMTTISAPRNNAPINSSAVWLHYIFADSWCITVPKGQYADLATAQAALAGTKIIFELATPVVTAITPTDMTAFQNGTIQIDSAIMPTLTFDCATNLAAQALLNNDGSAKSNAVLDAIISNWCHDNDTTLINGGKLYNDSVTSKQINVEELFSKNITATGTITGLNLNGANINLVGVADTTAKFTECDSTNSTKKLTLYPQMITVENGDGTKIKTWAKTTAKLEVTHSAGNSCILYATADTAYLGVSNGTNSSLVAPTHVDSQAFNNNSLASNKKNIEKIKSTLDLVVNSDIYQYNYKSEDDLVKKHIGFVIGKDYKTPDEIISKDESGNDSGIDIYSMCSVLWKAVQELKAQLDNI